MKRPTPLAFLLALAACSEAEVPASSPASAPDAGAASPAPGIQLGLRWETQVGGSGAGLTMFGPEGDAQLTIACTRSPAELIVTAETFQPIGSEERLTLGVGGEAYALVADPTAERPGGVEARGPVPAGLLDRLESANEVSASYGAQRLGPHIPPDPETARRFTAACRQAIAQPEPPSASAAPAVIPTGFRGEWNMKLDDCGTGLNDSRLRIDANRVRFYEGGGPVTAVERRGPNEIGVTVAVSGEGEGPSEQRYEFRLSADRSTLTDANGGLVRRRCPVPD